MNEHHPVVAENLSFFYDRLLILKEASFTIKQGEFIGIIGPNGGGKTTLLKLILGFLKPCKGNLYAFGKSPKASRKHMAYVPQAFHSDKQFPISVFEVVLSGMLAQSSWFGSYKKKEKEKALAMIEKMGLSELTHQAYGTLSGGQAQKTLIARALVSQPNLLLLDEPTASVDAKSEIEIHKILENLKNHQRDLTILMVTHDIRSIIENTQRIICVHHTVKEMAPKEVCEHFSMGLYHSSTEKLYP